VVTHDPELATGAQRNIHIIDGQVNDLEHEPVLRQAPASTLRALG
jgi:putative ABC transport system ATP-binding protein